MKASKYLVFFLALTLNVSEALGCTIFASPLAGDTRISHNVDWFTPYPNVKGVLVMNPADLKKRGELLGAKLAPAQWISKWKSLSFSIAGAEFPVSGFNEKGLTMGVLQLPEAQYPPIEDPRPGLGSGQFVQYNLDLSESIDDVIASVKMVRPYSTISKMHFFACDAAKNCAVLQFTHGQLSVYRDGALKYEILTNSLYPQSVKAADDCADSSTACQDKNNSLWRFSQAAKLRGTISSSQPYETQAFAVLNQIAQTGDGGLTRFQMIFSAQEQTIKIRKFGSTQTAELKARFDGVSCSQPRQVIFINAATQGDLANAWEPLTAEAQTDMALQMGYPVSAAKAYGKFPFESVSCQQGR